MLSSMLFCIVGTGLCRISMIHPLFFFFFFSPSKFFVESCTSEKCMRQLGYKMYKTNTMMIYLFVIVMHTMQSK